MNLDRRVPPVSLLRPGIARASIDRAESSRQSRLKIDFFSGDGVIKFQKLGVQQISSIAGEAGEILKRLAVQAVQRVAYQGMADGCQMDSDLMRAARMQAYLKCCCARACCLPVLCCLRCARSPVPMILTVCHLRWPPTLDR